MSGAQRSGPGVGLGPASAWDEVVADYAAIAEPLTGPLAAEALRLAGGVSPGERVLDLACGTGALAALLEGAGARVLAVDFSPGMVAHTAKRLGPGAEAIVMDGQALALPDAGFDSVWSMFGLFLFPDFRRGLAEARRVLGPGGRLVLASWAGRRGAGPAPLLAEALEALFPHAPPLRWPEGVPLLGDAGTLRAELAAAGFERVRVEAMAGCWTAPSAAWVRESAERLFRQMPGWLALGAADRLTVAEWIGDRLAAAFPGEVRLAAPALLAVAVRG